MQHEEPDLSQNFGQDTTQQADFSEFEEDIVNSLLSLANAEVPHPTLFSISGLCPLSIHVPTRKSTTGSIASYFAQYPHWIQPKRPHQQHTVIHTPYVNAHLSSEASARSPSFANDVVPGLLKRNISLEDVTHSTLYENEIPDDDSCGQSHTKAKRKRLNLEQIRVLNWVFSKTAFPSTELRKILGKTLCLSSRTIQIWFQNKRQSHRLKIRIDTPRGSYPNGMDNSLSPVNSATLLPGPDMKKQLDSLEMSIVRQMHQNIPFERFRH
jgi:hypothetical protein